MIPRGRPLDLDVHGCLSDRRRYERQIERLHKRYLFSGQLYELQQEGVSLASVIHHQSKVAKLIATTVARGDYHFKPAKVRRILVDGKERVVYALRLTDLIVHAVVADLIGEAMEPFLSPHLYSYRRGLSWWAPVSRFASYARAHRKSHPDPKTRGIYALRRDIDSYTDSIPVGLRSPLWRMLRDVLTPAAARDPISPADWRLIEEVVRPQAFVSEGRYFTLYRGVPTGLPISCVLFNLYLTAFDHELAQVPGSFYARYSDDILFAHPDAEVARAMVSRIDALVAGLELKINPQKRDDLYLTGAGRLSSNWPETRGTTSIEFLGCRLSADGTVSLNRKKARRLLGDLEERAVRTARATGDGDPDRTGRLVCSVINRVLDPRTPFLQQRSAALLRRAVTDRRQLKQLDYWIARAVLRAVTGKREVKVFRQVPYRTVRTRWRLVSVLQARNKWPRKPGR